MTEPRGDRIAESNSSPGKRAGGSRPALRALLFLITGSVAGLIAYATIDRFGSSFPLPPDAASMLEMDRLSPEQDRALAAARLRQSYQNTALTVAILGGVTGALLGLVVGVERGTFSASATGLGGGLLFGALLGAAGGLADVYTNHRLAQNDTVTPAVKTMAAHTAAFLGAGLGVGLGISLATRRIWQSAAMALAASAVAGLIYPVIAAAMFPMRDTDVVVPPRVEPLMVWTVLFSAIVGLGLGRLKVDRSTNGPDDAK